MKNELERMWNAVVDESEVLFRPFLGGAEKTHETLQSGQPITGPRFIPRTSRIRSRTAYRGKNLCTCIKNIIFQI
jgi:hypothetical protein